MSAGGSSFDPEKINLIARALGEAWREYEATAKTAATGFKREHLQKKMAQRLMAAVATGEFDPEKLKAIALSAATDV